MTARRAVRVALLLVATLVAIGFAGCEKRIKEAKVQQPSAHLYDGA